MKSLLLGSILLLGLGACGDDGTSDDTTDTADDGDIADDSDDTSMPDARPDTAVPDAPPPPDAQAECFVASSFGTVTQSNDITVDADGAPPQEFIVLDNALNAETPPDRVAVLLQAGQGVFADTPIATGTYQITGAETDFTTCGACVVVGADVQGNDAAALYMAQSGQLVITSLSPNFAGTLTNATFVHILVDENTGAQTIVDDGCTTSIASMSFDAPIAVDPK